MLSFTWSSCLEIFLLLPIDSNLWKCMYILYVHMYVFEYIHTCIWIYIVHILVFNTHAWLISSWLIMTTTVCYVHLRLIMFKRNESFSQNASPFCIRRDQCRHNEQSCPGFKHWVFFSPCVPSASSVRVLIPICLTCLMHLNYSKATD